MEIENPVILERVMGIEPTYSAWKAAALPLCYTRILPSVRKKVLALYTSFINLSRGDLIMDIDALQSKASFRP